MKRFSLCILSIIIVCSLIAPNAIFADSSHNMSIEQDEFTDIISTENADENVLSDEMESQGVEAYITRLYSLALNRVPDSEGFQNCVEALTSGCQTATEVAYGFIFSAEFQALGLSDDECVERMYQIFLDRGSDPEGKAFWLTNIANGMTKEGLFHGFSSSTEFFALCRNFGILRGYFVEGQPLGKTNQIYRFVSRLYTETLGREGDQQGLENWTNSLLEGRTTTTDMAFGFIFSPEANSRNLTRVEFITMLYYALMGRAPDKGGLQNWNQSGLSRQSIFQSFVNSPEFRFIVASYGLLVLPLAGKTVILDAGHGGKDSGCAYGGVLEKTVNLAIVLATKSALEAQGATVILTRSSDTWVGLYNRNAQVHEFALQYRDTYGGREVSDSTRNMVLDSIQSIYAINEDTVLSGGMGFMVGTGMCPELQEMFFMEQDLDNVVYISIHGNSATSSSVHGTKVYYVTDASMIYSENNMIKNNPEYSLPQSPIREQFFGRDGSTNAYFAQCLYNGVTSAESSLQTTGSQTVTDNFCVLREQGLTSAMIEVGYLSNARDRALLTDPAVQARVAVGITNGLIAYWGV